MSNDEKNKEEFLKELHKMWTETFTVCDIVKLDDKYPVECQWFFNDKIKYNELYEKYSEKHKLFGSVLSAFYSKRYPSITKSDPIKLVIHQKQLYMWGNDMATKNSTLMLSVVETPKDALNDLRNERYSVDEINYPNSMGWTPLMYVARYSKKTENGIELMKELMKQGALVNQYSTSQNSILFMVVLNNSKDSSIEALDLLLGHPNILVNHQNSVSYFTALYSAVKRSNCTSSVDAVRRLLEHPDCDPTLTYTDGSDAFLTGLKCLNSGLENNAHIDALILLIKSPKYKLNLKDKMKWIAKNSETDNKNYLETILNLYKEHNPSGIFL